VLPVFLFCQPVGQMGDPIVACRSPNVQIASQRLQPDLLLANEWFEEKGAKATLTEVLPLTKNAAIYRVAGRKRPEFILEKATILPT
jgi:hypothetical protein